MTEIHEKLEGEESHGGGRVANATFGAVLVQILLLDIVFSFDSVKMLALAFLVLIGAFLIADGFDVHVDKALIYGPMAFAIAVEALNIIQRRRQAKLTGKDVEPVHLRDAYSEPDGDVVATSGGTHADTVTLSPEPVTDPPHAPENGHPGGSDRR